MLSARRLTVTWSSSVQRPVSSASNISSSGISFVTLATGRRMSASFWYITRPVDASISSALPLLSSNGTELSSGRLSPDSSLACAFSISALAMTSPSITAPISAHSTGIILLDIMTPPANFT